MERPSGFRAYSSGYLPISERNPRSHSKYVDKQADADAIILFINYLIHIIDQSKAPFTKSEFLKRVFDPHFVEKERYARLLVEEIPTKYRFEIMLDVFRSRETADGRKLTYFVSALLKTLTKEQKSDLYAAMSQEFKLTDSDAAIRTVLQIFPSDSLSHIDESARLRIENKLIQSIRDGLYNEQEKHCNAGALGTWASGTCIDSFLLKDELINVLTNKLSSGYPEEQAYVFQYFWSDLKRLTNLPSGRFLREIKNQLKRGNKALYDQLIIEQTNIWGNKEWVEAFKDEIMAFQEQEPIPNQLKDDDIPF